MARKNNSKATTSKAKGSGSASDKRTGDASAETVNPAARTIALDAKVEATKLGIGKINVLQIENKLLFGRYNDRPLKESEVNKMIASYEKHGMQWTKSENALAIVIEPARLAPEQDLEGAWNSPDTLTSVAFADTKPIHLASGQHRVAALKKMLKKYTKEEGNLDKRLLKLQDKDPVGGLSAEDALEQEELQKRLAFIKGRIEEMGQWGVIIYDIGMLDADKAVGKHLSKNQVLHQYTETQEEQLVSILRDMADAMDEGGEAAALKVLKSQHELPAVNKNSKLTKVLYNARLMVVLMRDILPLGPHFRGRRELTVPWLSKSMKVVMGIYARYMQRHTMIWRYIGSKEEGPSFEEVREMVEASEQGDDEEGAQEAVKGLVSLMENMSLPEYDDSLVLTPFMDEIDEIANRCFKTYEGSLGARNADYEQALRLYRTDVVEALRQGFAKQAHSSQEEKRWHDVIVGRAYMTLSDTRSEHLPVPLMTGYVLDRIWGEFEAAKNGYTEIASWFEALLHTMKIFAGHAHAVDDHTEALFSAIERERGMNNQAALNEVVQLLTDARFTGVLHLHNKLSDVDVQSKMGKRPTTKDEFHERWTNVSGTVQARAKSMFTDHKEHFGIGKVDMPISSMGLPCMHALLVTGWDWQRPNIRKNLGREAEPLIQAMFFELDFVKKYRTKILRDSNVWGVRESMRVAMTDAIPQGKGKLKPKEWTYWDGIKVDKPEDDAESIMDEETQAFLAEENRRLAAEAVDRDSIMKIRKLIYQLRIAHVTHHKNSPLTPEVARAVNMLTRALELSSSRHRMRALSGIEKKQFNVALDVVSLNIPDWTGEIDLDTINDPNPEHTDGEGDGADGDDEGDEDAPSSPKPSPIKDKGKGKAKVKKHVPVIAEDEDEDDDMDVIAGPSRAKSRQADNDVEMNAPDVQTVVAPRPKPRPKPVPVKKAGKSVAKLAEELFPREPVNDGQDTTDGRAEFTDGRDDATASDAQGLTVLTSSAPAVGNPPSADTSLDIQTSLTGMNIGATSPLSSPPPDEPMKLVTDFELAAELDAQENKRRSSRAKLPSRPRAAPVVSSRTAASSVATGSARSSLAPQSSKHSGTDSASVSKRVRRDTNSTASPPKKKRAKHDDSVSLSSPVDEGQTQMTVPDM